MRISKPVFVDKFKYTFLKENKMRIKILHLDKLWNEALSHDIIQRLVRIINYKIEMLHLPCPSPPAAGRRADPTPQLLQHSGKQALPLFWTALQSWTCRQEYRWAIPENNVGNLALPFTFHGRDANTIPQCPPTLTAWGSWGKFPWCHKNRRAVSAPHQLQYSGEWP